MAYDVNNPTDDVSLVRLLTNDTSPNPIYTDSEIQAFLTLEGDSVKRAAAQIIDTIADDEALTSKVIKDHNLQTDGAKLADALRKRAALLRTQADDDDEGDGYFELVPMQTTAAIDITSYPW